ncbi:MAG: hypothetical protein K8S98_17860 [Planctomycetes bacterium]|nr:hypothetical protein [Planctomycetota bacterium]
MKSILLVPLLLLAAHHPQDPGTGPRKGGGLGACCVGKGASCLFGTAAPCIAYCGGGNVCSCSGASCTFGFPQAAQCSCGGDLS